MKQLAAATLMVLASCSGGMKTTVQPGTLGDAFTTAATVASDRATEFNPFYKGLSPVEALVAHTVLNIAAKEALVAGGSDPKFIDDLWNAGGFGVTANNILALAGVSGAGPIVAGGLVALFVWTRD